MKLTMVVLAVAALSACVTDVSLDENQASVETVVGYYENRQRVAIPDNNSTGIFSSIYVGDAIPDMGNRTVRVHVNITHTYVGDLIVTLNHAGQSWVLHNRIGGSNHNIDRSFTLTDFVGAVEGEWWLHVRDTASANVGMLEYWTLEVVEDQASPETIVGYYENRQRVSIPDNNAAGISTTISVDDAIPYVVNQTVRVHVNITHTYIGDLSVTLYHSGQFWTLHGGTGGSADNIDQTYTLPSSAGPVQGQWVLIVQDWSAQDVGALEYWTLEIANPHDVTAPTVSWISPSNNTLRSGIVDLWATAWDDRDVAEVQFHANGRRIGSTVAAPYAIAWDSRTVADGPVTLSVSARDAAGNVGRAPDIIVILDNTAPVISDIRVASITTTGALVSWQTSEASPSRVQYGTTASYGLEATNLKSATFHSMQLGMLQPTTTYHYRVGSTDQVGNVAWSSDRKFKTRR